MTTPREKALVEFHKWVDELPRPSKRSTVPHPGSIAVALVVLDRLRTDFNLKIDSHLTDGGGQIRGAGGPAIQRILREFGEMRPFVGEGGRSSRGTINKTRELLAVLERTGVRTLKEAERTALLTSLLEVLIKKVREFHNQQRLKPVYDPARSTRQFVCDLLTLAEDTGKRGSVAQYLVGAKLQLRFPGVVVRNESASAADDPTAQPGDFVVGDTTFHVTVAPTTGHYDKCLQNLREGRRVYLLVPDGVVLGARQNADLATPGRIAVESVESFVANWITLRAGGSNSAISSVLVTLCEQFNALVLKDDLEASLRWEWTELVDAPEPIIIHPRT